MKYKLIKTDLMYKGNIITENSIVEMTADEAEKYSDFLEPVEPAVRQTTYQQPKSKKKSQTKRGPKSKQH